MYKSSKNTKGSGEMTNKLLRTNSSNLTDEKLQSIVNNFYSTQQFLLDNESSNRNPSETNIRASSVQQLEQPVSNNLQSHIEAGDNESLLDK